MTAYELAQRYVGIRELEHGNHPLVQWWLSLCFDGRLDIPDETPWCSAFVNGMAWEMRLPRSKSAMARSWLKVGTPIDLRDAAPGYDVVILWRGSREAETGHVGFFAGVEDLDAEGQPHGVLLLGGNQNDSVSIQKHGAERVLGVRRLA